MNIAPLCNGSSGERGFLRPKLSALTLLPERSTKLGTRPLNRASGREGLSKGAYKNAAPALLQGSSLGVTVTRVTVR